MNDPSSDSLSTLVSQSSIRGQRAALIKKIREVYGDKKADEVEKLAAEKYKTRGYSDYCVSRPLWNISILEGDE